ncbi:MAG: beta-3-deoxy-D-manno-oct-2-ulosonic acid transferase [Sphingobium sp.]
MSSFAEALFTVPPFPGANPVRILRKSHAPLPVAPEACAALAEAVRRERVGGAFWDDRDPWTRFDHGDVCALSGDDPLVLLAAIAGCPVICETAGAFAELSGLKPGSAAHAEQMHALIAEHLVAAVEWHDPYTGEPSSPLRIIAQLGAWRRLIEGNRGIRAAFGFAAWKQDTVAALLWPGDAPPPFAAPSPSQLDRLPPHSTVAVWKARVPPAFLSQLEQSGRPILEVEDGFIRSIGLGADCVPPLSIVVDDRGAHYDPSHPCRLEEMLLYGQPDAATLTRARALRERIAASGISKYGVGGGTRLPRPAGDRPHILVTGQVEDDRSVLLGGGGLTSNHELLRRVRALRPDAYIIYRPHPDVEAGHRKGHVAPTDMLALADASNPASPISDLIAMVDEVHVLTSLAGFEALLHGKPVVTHGIPFYAGWGLTTDLAPVPSRRNRSISLDHLVAAVLIEYPRYIDPVTGLPCEVELVIERMGAGVQRQKAALVMLRQGWGLLRRNLVRIRQKK